MPHPAETSAAGPSRFWYLAALVIFAAGLAAMGVLLSKAFSGLGGGLVQIVVPGETELALEPGSYTIFHETQSIVGGKLYQSDGIGGLTVSVLSPAEEAVALTTPAMGGSYEFAGRRGVAAFGFEIGEPGTYRLSASYGEGAAGPETVLAVGKGFAGTLLATVLGGLALVFICAGVAVAIAVRGSAKRRRARAATSPVPGQTTRIRFALPATKTFVYVFGGALAVLVGLAALSDILENTFGPELPPPVQPAYHVILFALVLVTIYSAVPLVVRSVINFQLAFWRGVGRTASSATVTDIVAEVTPGARLVCDIIILVGWAILTLGLAFVLPEMIKDGFFS